MRQCHFAVDVQKSIVRVTAHARQKTRGNFHRADFFVFQHRCQLRHAFVVQITHGLLDHFRHQKQTALHCRCAALVGLSLVGLVHHVFAQTQRYAEFVGVCNRLG